MKVIAKITSWILAIICFVASWSAMIPVKDILLILLGKLQPGEMVYPDFPALTLGQYFIWLTISLGIAGTTMKLYKICKKLD